MVSRVNRVSWVSRVNRVSWVSRVNQVSRVSKTLIMASGGILLLEITEAQTLSVLCLQLEATLPPETNNRFFLQDKH